MPTYSIKLTLHLFARNDIDFSDWEPSSWTCYRWISVYMNWRFVSFCLKNNTTTTVKIKTFKLKKKKKRKAGDMNIHWEEGMTSWKGVWTVANTSLSFHRGPFYSWNDRERELNLIVSAVALTRAIGEKFSDLSILISQRSGLEYIFESPG